MIDVVLQKAALARTANFDLLTDSAWSLLREEIVADFPYLTLEELNATIKLGIKGKLDKYKSAPLNFTRIYQWVEKNAPQSVGYWRTKFPELLAWADATKVTAALVPAVVKLGEIHGFDAMQITTVKHALKTLIETTHYPNLAAGTPPPSEESRALQLESRTYVETVLWPAFRQQHPAFAAKFPNLF